MVNGKKTLKIQRYEHDFLQSLTWFTFLDKVQLKETVEAVWVWGKIQNLWSDQYHHINPLWSLLWRDWVYPEKIISAENQSWIGSANGLIFQALLPVFMNWMFALWFFFLDPWIFLFTAEFSMREEMCPISRLS